MRILSLDQSLASTGWSVFHGNQLQARGIIATNPKWVLLDRLEFIVDSVQELVEQYEIDTILTETPSSTRNMDVTRKLVSVWAIIKFTFRHLIIKDIHCQSVKAQAKRENKNGKSGAKKKKKDTNTKVEVKNWVNRTLVIEEDRLDVTDSLGIALHYLTNLEKYNQGA